MNERQNNDSTGELLDATLARMNAEPREGLEGRILAGVAARERSAGRLRWVLALGACGAAAALAVVVILAAHLNALRPNSAPAVAKQLPTGSSGKPLAGSVSPTPSLAKGGNPALKNEAERTPRPPARRGPRNDSAAGLLRKMRRPLETAAISHRGRPEQFPAPAPLTEQEKLLLLYVKLTPEEELKATAGHQPIKDLKIEDITLPEIKELPGHEAGGTS